MVARIMSRNSFIEALVIHVLEIGYKVKEEEEGLAGGSPEGGRGSRQYIDRQS